MIVLKGRVLDGNGGAPIENKLLYGEIHGLKRTRTAVALPVR